MDICLYDYRLPLRDPLAIGSSVLRERAGLLVGWSRGEGEVIWGEAAPLPGYSPDSLDEATSQLEQAVTNIRKDGITEERIRQEALALSAPSARCALDMLIWDDEPRADVVAVGALLTDGTEEQVRAVRDAGYEAVKLKVGRDDLEAEIERVHAIAEILPYQARVRLDANRAWDLDEAIYFCSRITDCPIDYIEEPLRDANLLPELSSVPLALDETLRDIHPDALQQYDDVRALVIKPTCLGGDRARDWAETARRLGIQVVVSSAYESGIGMRHLARWAAAHGSPGASHGLDTARPFEQDVVEPRLPLAGPKISWRDLFGAPYKVNEERLKRRL